MGGGGGGDLALAETEGAREGGRDDVSSSSKLDLELDMGTEKSGVGGGYWCFNDWGVDYGERGSGRGGIDGGHGGAILGGYIAARRLQSPKKRVKNGEGRCG